MKYTEENIKKFFERFLGSNAVKVSTYYQLYNMLEDIMGRTGICMDAEEIKLWNRMTRDYITINYLQLEE